jgi:hypothetical protein
LKIPKVGGLVVAFGFGAVKVSVHLYERGAFAILAVF